MRSLYIVGVNKKLIKFAKYNTKLNKLLHTLYILAAIYFSWNNMYINILNTIELLNVF